MKIDILCPHGSPLGVIPEDIYDRGVGGAELALLTFSEVMAQRGHAVTVYNEPRIPGVHCGVQFAPLDKWNHADERDVMILFRAPHHTFSAARGRRIFWSCDQYTVGNFATEIFPHADRVVVISDFHRDYFKKTYGLDESKMIVISLGIREQDYKFEVERVKNRLIYCSVPGRGLHVVAQMWPRVLERVPDASLVITSDYRLWGLANPENHQFRLMFYGLPNVEFFGKVPRAQLCQLQKSADAQFFPCTYEELFCYAVAECKYAGAVPITSDMGALATTNSTGVKIAGSPENNHWQNRCLEQIKTALVDNRTALENSRSLCIQYAMTSFSWDTLAVVWEGVFNGDI